MDWIGLGWKYPGWVKYRAAYAAKKGATGENIRSQRKDNIKVNISVSHKSQTNIHSSLIKWNEASSDLLLSQNHISTSQI